MDDLRWILLLVGVVVLVVVYFSGRFESEEWTRERKQSRTGRHDKADSKKKIATRTTVKKEPAMGMVEPEFVAEKPEQHELDVARSSAKMPEAKSVADPVSPTVFHDEMVMQESATKTGQDMPVDNKSETVNIEHSGIEDEITGIEIPVDLAVMEAEIHITDIVVDDEPEWTAMPSGIEPLVLSVSVFADEGENFGGLAIKEALEAEGVKYGTMHIFHFHDPDKTAIAKNDDAVFSVASVLEPGFFDLEKLDELQTPGLMLFCQLPGPLSGENALEIMLDKGRGLAVRLHGHMCDDKRNRFTSQAKNHYLDRITAFNRKLVLARKKI